MASEPTEVDVVVIGTGQAGVPLATALTGGGRRVVVIERGELGGTCVNNGCTPTKTMIASSRVAHQARVAGRFGVRVGSVEVDLAAVVERKEQIVQRWRDGVKRRLEEAGSRLRLVRGVGRFVGPHTVEVVPASGPPLRFSAPTIVINTGARASLPPLSGLDRVPYLDNASALEVRRVPAHLLVLGGGYVACELGQMFRRFGARVTIVGDRPHLLPREDPEVSAPLEQVFRDEGIELRLGVKGVAVRQPEPGGPDAPLELELASGERLVGSHLLVATGRRPNTEDLACAAAGVELDGDGHVVADDQYRTSAPGVYAVGDVLHGPQFTHVSWDDHRRLLAVLEGKPRGGRADMIVPFAVFSDPQVAGVGLSEAEARKQGLPFHCATLPFGSIARAIETDQTAGVLKVLVDPGSRRLLGARIVGADAGELIHVFATLMQTRASTQLLVDGQMVHPTFAEGLQSVLSNLPPPP